MDAQQIALENHMEYKYWRKVTRGTDPVVDQQSIEDIRRNSLDIQEVTRENFSLVGRTVSILYKPSLRPCNIENQLRLRCECTVVDVGSPYANYLGDREVLVELQRSDGTKCILGLSMEEGTVLYWTPAIHSEFCLWYVHA